LLLLGLLASVRAIWIAASIALSLADLITLPDTIARSVTSALPLLDPRLRHCIQRQHGQTKRRNRQPLCQVPHVKPPLVYGCCLSIRCTRISGACVHLLNVPPDDRLRRK
jgi:hypothetical protein